MTQRSRHVALPDEAAMERLAADLAVRLPAPFVMHLRGDLGAGKTTFARAVIRALGFAGRVKSPTYGLLETYALANRTVLHLDLYRLEDPSDLEYLAIPDLFGDDGLLLIEWPERGGRHVPAPDLELYFDYAGKGRELRLEPRSPAARDLLRGLRAA